MISFMIASAVVFIAASVLALTMDKMVEGR